MAIKRNIKSEAGLSMSSMTDIVFLLLLFFLVTSTLINPNALKLLLPKSTGQVAARATATVSIKDHHDGHTYSYHINGNSIPVAYSQIESELQSLIGDEDDPTFSIYADATVPVGEVVSVMNIAKRNKFKVIMATAPEE